MMAKNAVSILLSLQGIIFLGIGLYFIFLRPSLLPEDLRYMNASLTEIQQKLPGLLSWLQKVFTVMGAYIATLGILVLYLAQTPSFFKAKFSYLIIIVTSLTSIGVMTIVNFILSSDFRFILLLFNLPWIICLGLFMKQKNIHKLS